MAACLLAVAPAAPAWAGQADWSKLPDTGQAKCYNNSGEIACPQPGEAFYGQDAQYQGVARSYQDNGNGTVTDRNTKLVWQQTDDGTTRTWANAISYCDGLTLAGQGDWRLPFQLELSTIVDFGRVNPAIDTAFFPGCRSSYYWSSASNAGYTSNAWIVSFYNGFDNYSNKTNSYYVRCVRGGL